MTSKSVGIVTTTRVQHASPAAAYAHSVSRSWYSDGDLPASARRHGCVDIATQMVTNVDIDGTPDPEYPTSSSRKGDREDKKNLIEQWLKAKPGKLSMASTVSSPDLPSICPFRIRAAVTVDTPIPARGPMRRRVPSGRHLDNTAEVSAYSEDVLWGPVLIGPQQGLM
ncbi:hypothetical protein CRUP_033939, partial [Coryphaenoides rupestris]